MLSPLRLERVRRSSSQTGIVKWKVDHPEKATKGGRGSKDVSDAVAGVVWLLLTDPRAQRGAPILDEETRQKFSTGTKRVVDPAATPKPVKKGRKRKLGAKTLDIDKLRDNVRKPR